MNKKGLVLLSGGLDSALSARVLLEQGIELEAVNFCMSFYSGVDADSCRNASQRTADELGIKLHAIDVSEEYLEVLKNPRHGYGRHFNPCIDCKIFMLKKARGLMKETGASFIVTGEVLGERPMSQRRDALNIINKETGLKGLIVRPLSAKHLDITIPEEKGVIDREKLLDIKGRSRKPQFALVDKFGMKNFSAVAGGCLLTDEGFSRRLKDLIDNGELDLPNIKLLKLGRHYRYKGAKIVIGRDKGDNEKLLTLAKGKDIIVKVKDIPGPITLIRGKSVPSTIVESAASLTAGYTKSKSSEFVMVEYRMAKEVEPNIIKVAPRQKEDILDQSSYI